MVEFVRKRLQVFVSSTFTDLRHERQAAVEAILTAGHIPAGMELFTSGDESQMEVIKQWIDESDVYLLILGGRYGSFEPKSGLSYTQLEYEYALQSGKPLFSCVITDAALETRIRSYGSDVLEREHPVALRAFRAQVMTRLIRHWDDHKDIKIAVGETLAQFARREDLVGWVRPTHTAIDLEKLANEISRLSQENSQLRTASRIGAPDPLIAGFTFPDLHELLSSKNLLSFLKNNRNAFVSDFGLDSDSDGKGGELRFLGLLEIHPHGFGLMLSNEGKRFLSRVDLMELRQSSVLGAA